MNIVLALILILSTLRTINANDLSSIPSGALALTPGTFIEFLKLPPAIDTLIFRRILFNKPRHFKSQQEADKFIEDYKAGKRPDDNKSEELFALRYLSSKNYIFHQIDDPTNAWLKTTRLMTFCGRDDGNSWTLTSTGAISTDSTNGIYKTRGEDNPAMTFQYQFATEILRLGMYDLNLSTIQQTETPASNSGDIHFAGRSNNGDTIKGIAKAVDGLISQITYTILGTSAIVQGRLIEVVHKNGVLFSIKISNVIIGQHDPILHSYYEVVGTPILASSLPKHPCEVNQFLTESDKSILVKANGDMYNLKGNVLVPVVRHPTLNGDIADNINGAYKRVVILLVFAAALVVPLVLIYFQSKKGKRN